MSLHWPKSLYGVITSVSEVVTPQTGTLRNRMPSRTVSLPTQVSSWIETVASGVQRGQVVRRSGRSDTRTGAMSPAATYCRQWRAGVRGRRGVG